VKTTNKSCKENFQQEWVNSVKQIIKPPVLVIQFYKGKLQDQHQATGCPDYPDLGQLPQDWSLDRKSKNRGWVSNSEAHNSNNTCVLCTVSPSFFSSSSLNQHPSWGRLFQIKSASLHEVHLHRLHTACKRRSGHTIHSSDSLSTKVERLGRSGSHGSMLTCSNWGTLVMERVLKRTWRD